MNVRRRILEWVLWLSITALLGVISLEAASFFIPRSESFVRIGRGFYAFLRPGWIDVASDLDSASGSPAPANVNPRNIIAPPVRRSGTIDFPGFSLSFCLFRGNSAIWSAKISLLVPLVLSSFMIALLYYRLTRLKMRKVTPPRSSLP